MSFKISIPNKSKINPPLMKSEGDRSSVHGSPSGPTAPLPSNINGTPSDKIRRPSNSDILKSNFNIQRPSVMKSGESTLRVEKDIFSKKPSFLYTSTFGSDRSPSGMELGASALPVENDIFLKKPSFLYANSTLQMGVEKDIFSNKPSFLYTASEARNFIYERKETIDSLDTANLRERVVLSDVDGSEVTAKRPHPETVTASMQPEVTALSASNTKDNERRYSTINIKNFLNNCDSIK